MAIRAAMNTAISPVSLWVFRLGKCYSLMAICMPTKVYLVLWIWHPIAAFSCIVYFIVSVGLLIIIQNKSRHNILLWLVSTAWLKLLDRKSTRLNSSHVAISYAVFCLKKKIK